MTTMTARHANLNDLATLLTEQQIRKVDMVVPSTQMGVRDGVLIVRGAEAQLGPDGVTTVDGRYLPTEMCQEGIASKLNVPLAYLKRMFADRPDLYEATVNGWLHGSKPKRHVDGTTTQRFPADDRKFLVRAFRPDSDDTPGIARAFLSDSYRVMDNLDALTAALDGIKEAGVEVEFAGCDLTERRMTVKVIAPAVQALAPTLLAGYRSPFSGQNGTDNPTVFAGFVLSNSETGGGAFTIVPRLTVQVCSNGMVVSKDAMRAVHLGGKMDEGLIRWSDETQQKTVELVRLKTRDAVATFLDTDYMEKVLARVEEKAGKEVSDANAAIEFVSKKSAFTQAEQAGILSHFVRGGQMTVGGVFNSVTAMAQTVTDADRAYEMEWAGLKVLDLLA